MTQQEREKIQKLRLVFIGRPGSGKGTQVGLMRKRFGMIVIPSPGDVYRDPKFRKTKLGKIVAPIVDSGEFAPNEITNQIMKEKIIKITRGKGGFISEGYPRTMGQAKFADKEIGVDWLINLKVPNKTIVKRLSARRICPKCKFNYNLITIPPKKTNTCDNCKTILIQRKDDKPKAIKTRLKVYRQTAEPTIKYYRKKGKLIEVNGDQPLTKVFKDIVQVLLEKI